MNGTMIIGIIAAFLVLIILIGYRNRKAEKRLFREKCAAEYGAAPSSRIKKMAGSHTGYYYANRGDYHVDNITWNDLSMDDVFERINYCETTAGKEYLYYLLRCPRLSDDGFFAELEEKLSGLQKSENERIDIKECLHDIGGSGKYSLYDYLPIIDKGSAGSNALHYVMLMLLIISIPLMAFWNFSLGFIVFIICVAINIVSYFKIKAEVRPYLVTFAYVLRLLSGAEALMRLKDSVFSDHIREIEDSEKRLKAFARGSWILSPGEQVTGSGNPIDILMDYVRMATHIDLIRFNRMYKKLQSETGSVYKLNENIGYIDAVLSICYYRASDKDGFCIPELTEGSESYRIQGGRHPLMEEPVANSFEASKGVLITGSNASGKSTFLKMCAINTIFAQSIHTCNCKAYRAPFYRVFSSMALRDDLEFGDSYYMVEIKSLKRILDASDTGKAPVLCFIDEVLRGTNTVERIAASSKILEHFAGQGGRVMCFAATHDGELTDILSELYDVRHFEGEMDGDDVVFDYKLKKGPATGRNAISLLKSIGYSDSIVTEAEKMAVRFEDSGVWKL